MPDFVGVFGLFPEGEALVLAPIRLFGGEDGAFNLMSVHDLLSFLGVLSVEREEKCFFYKGRRPLQVSLTAYGPSGDTPLLRRR